MIKIFWLLQLLKKKNNKNKNKNKYNRRASYLFEQRASEQKNKWEGGGTVVEVAENAQNRYF